MSPSGAWRKQWGGQRNDTMGFSSKQTVIVGLGLMGASLAWALRPHVEHLVAVEPDAASRALAVERKIVDEATDEGRVTGHTCVPEADAAAGGSDR